MKTAKILISLDVEEDAGFTLAQIARYAMGGIRRAMGNGDLVHPEVELDEYRIEDVNEVDG